MNFKPRINSFYLFVVLFSFFNSIVFLEEAHSQNHKYKAWSSNRDFEYRWVNQIPKDAFYRGVWQGMESLIYIKYRNNFRCNLEMPDGTTNSIEVALKLTTKSKVVTRGRGFALLMSEKSPYKISVTFLYLPKEFSNQVAKVQIENISCRM